MSPLDANALTPVLRDALVRSAPGVIARSGDGIELMATAADTLIHDIENAQQRVGALDLANTADRAAFSTISQTMLDQADALEQIRAAVATSLGR